MRLLGLFLLSSVLVCCESASSPHAYFPLGEGRVWTYQILLTPGYETKEQIISIRASHPPVDVTRLVGITEFSDGKEVLYENLIPIQHENDTLYYYRHHDDGIDRIAFQSSGNDALRWDDPVRPVLRYPLIEGQSWQTASQTYLLLRRLPLDMGLRATEPFFMTYTIEKTQVIETVPAGTFTDCIRVQGRGKASFIGYRGTGSIDVVIEQTDTYAANVGLIKSQRIEKTSSQLFGTNYYLMQLHHYED